MLFLVTERKLKARSCSIGCYKKHQAAHPNCCSFTRNQPTPNGLPPKPPPVAFVKPPQPPDSSEISLSTINVQSLGSSPTLQRLYTRYPELRGQLRDIYDAMGEPSDEAVDDHHHARGRGDRNRRGFRNRGRGNGRNFGGRWTQEKGFISGLHRLRRLRQLHGKEGAGLQEFSKFVNGLNEAKAR